MTHRIGIIVGSLRKQSINRKVAQTLIKLSAGDLAMQIVEIGQLPHCNADLEADPPAAITEFKRLVESLDAFLFVTPEYNRGVPGFVKNALDIGSRPYGRSSWKGKPVGVISVSPGGMGGFGANHQLRQSFVFLDMPAMQQPEAYIGDAGSLFNENGEMTDPSTMEFLGTYLKAFAQWVERHRAPAGK